MEEVNELVAVFMEEAETRLRDLKSALEQKEINETGCEKARISSHTIKGMSSQMGYDKTAAVSKEIEQFFISVKEIKKLPSASDMQVINEGVWVIEKLFDELKKSGAESSDVSGVVDKIQKLTSSFKGE